MNYSFEHLPFEGEYADENGWDMWFRNCKMKKDFGDLKKDDTFDSIYVSYDCSIMSFYKETEDEEEYKKIANYKFETVFKFE